MHCICHFTAWASPPDHGSCEWKDRVDEWTAHLKTGKTGEDRIAAQAREFGLRAMPIRDQIDLQLTFIAAGLEQVQLEREGRA